MINSYIFREYDIRGKVADDFPDHVVVKLGKAFGTFVRRAGRQEIGLSGDIRLTTPELMQSFKEGVLSTGTDIINLGIVPTPVNYFSMFHLGVAGAVQITGSHNPPEFNGFKLSLDKKAVYGKDIQTLYQTIEKMDFEEGEGTETRYRILPDYKKMFLEKIFLDKPMKVVMDCGNAAGAINGPELFKELDLELKELFCETDGTFPNHHPDPTVEENLQDLIREMKTGQYDVGLAFDGDADRVFLVDERARSVSGSTTTALVARRVLQREPRATVLYNLICSRAVPEVIAENGGRAIRTRVGHSIIKQAMAEEGAAFAGEHSGHYYFRDNYRADSGLIAALLVLEALSEFDGPMSDLLAPYERYAASGERNTSVGDPAAVIDRVAAHYADWPQDRLDGLTVDLGDWWFNVRPSNTEPLLRLNVEAADEATCQIRVAEVQAVVGQ